MTFNTEYSIKHIDEDISINPFSFNHRIKKHSKTSFFDANLSLIIARNFDNDFFTLFLKDNKPDKHYNYSLLVDGEEILSHHVISRGLKLPGFLIKQPLEKTKNISINIYDGWNDILQSFKVDIKFDLSTLADRIKLTGIYKKLHLPFIYKFKINKNGSKLGINHYTIEVFANLYSNEVPTEQAISFFSKYDNGYWKPDEFQKHLEIKGNEIKILNADYEDLNTFKTKKTIYKDSSEDGLEIYKSNSSFSFDDSFKYNPEERKIKPWDPVNGKNGILINPNYEGELIFSKKIEIERFGKFELLWKQRFGRTDKFPNKKNYFTRLEVKDLDEDQFYNNKFTIESINWTHILSKEKVTNEYLENRYLYKKEENDE